MDINKLSEERILMAQEAEKEKETLDMLMNYVQMFSAYETLFT